MRLADPIIGELEHEGKSTLRMLERVPADKLAWSPHAKSMTLGELAWHIASIPARAVYFIREGSFEVGDARPPRMPEGAVDFTGTFLRNMADLRKTIDALDDSSLKARFAIKQNGEMVTNIPKIAMIRTIVLNHSYHHRGQLSVYLRLLDVPLPAIYGTSADENGVG